MIEVVPQLNKILKERNMTQNDLSNLTGIAQPVISRFDKNGQYRINQLFLIARALELNIEDLFIVTELKFDIVEVSGEGLQYVVEDGITYLFDTKSKPIKYNDDSTLDTTHAFKAFYPPSHEGIAPEAMNEEDIFDTSSRVFNNENKDELDKIVNAWDKKKE